MNRKDFRDRYAARAVLSWQKKIIMLNDLESKMEADMKTYCELTGVKILDVQLYDPETCEIQLEVDI